MVTVDAQVAPALEDALARVDEFFAGVFEPLDDWLPTLRGELKEQLVKGRITGQQLASIAEAGAHQILDTADRPLYGAGFCGSDLVVSEGNPLAWWQGVERNLLASSTFGPGQAAIDLVRLEWYRVPAATGERHIAGPFVDYLCSNEITVTSTLPLLVDGDFWGVMCADVLVSSLEAALLPTFTALQGVASVTLVNESGRVVLSTAADYETGDRYRGIDPTAGVATLAGGAHLARSRVYPFALIAE